MVQILIDDKFYLKENQVALYGKEYEADDVKSMISDIIEWCFNTTDLEVLHASADETGAIYVYFNENYLSVWIDRNGKLRAEHTIAGKKNNNVWHFESTEQVIIVDESIEEVLE